MAERRRIWPLLLLAVLLGATACYAVLRHLLPGPEPEKVYLPGKTVVREVVKESILLENQVLREQVESLGLSLDHTTGRLRDAEGRLAELHQWIEINTGTVEPPEPREIVRIVKEACDDPDPRGRIEASLLEFTGLTEGGDLNYGWAGDLRCHMSLDGGGNWAVLVDQPLTLSNTRSMGTTRPEPVRRVSRLGYYGEAAYRLSPSIYDYQFTSLSSMEVGGGLSLRIGKRWHASAGVGFDSEDFLVRGRVTYHPWK